jgi:hypothetical protein
MIRITSLAALGVLACGLALGADSRAETTTYVDGNLTGVAPNTGGTLLFSDDKAVYFRTGLETIPVPYASISKAELGATKVHSHDVPLYKVWALHKRFSGKTETQLLTLAFKTEEGEEKTMTLELAQSVASNVLSTIQSHSVEQTVPTPPVVVASAEPAEPTNPPQALKPARPAQAKPAAEGWWGDSIWKTTRNADKWNRPAATSAPDQQQK